MRDARGFGGDVFLHKSNRLISVQTGGLLHKLKSLFRCAVLKPHLAFGEQLHGHLKGVYAGAAHTGDAFVEFLCESDDFLSHELAVVRSVKSADLPELYGGGSVMFHGKARFGRSGAARAWADGT